MNERDLHLALSDAVFKAALALDAVTRAGELYLASTRPPKEIRATDEDEQRLLAQRDHAEEN